MPSRLKRLRELEQRYNGPIPRTARDAVLFGKPPAVLAAQEGVQFNRRQFASALEAKARWRGDRTMRPQLPPLRLLERETAHACATVCAARQFVAWRIHLKRLQNR